LVFGILQEHFPAAIRSLQGVQVKRDEIVEEEAFDLTTKDVYL
jgi:hypothetical protein